MLSHAAGSRRSRPRTLNRGSFCPPPPPRPHPSAIRASVHLIPNPGPSALWAGAAPAPGASTMPAGWLGTSGSDSPWFWGCGQGCCRKVVQLSTGCSHKRPTCPLLSRHGGPQTPQEALIKRGHLPRPSVAETGRVPCAGQPGPLYARAWALDVSRRDPAAPPVTANFPGRREPAQVINLQTSHSQATRLQVKGQ